MARSTVIYVVILKEDGLPVAGFTDTDDLVSWTQVRGTSTHKFFRVEDGLRQQPEVTEIFYPFEKK